MAKEKLGFVISEFNHEITEKMSKIAQSHAKKLGAEVMEVVKVAGAFEIPFAVKMLLKRKDIHGVVTIGTIIKGGTDHDVVIANAVAKKLLELSLEHNKPVSLGISGPNITWKQSKERIQGYALRSVNAVIKMLRLKGSQKN